MINEFITNIIMPFFEYLQDYQLVLLLFFILLNVTFAIFFLPCSVFAVLAGSIWGDVGTLVSVTASLAANASTFTISRTKIRSWIRGYLARRFPDSHRYFTLMETHDWKIIAAIQLNPILPAASFGYFVGLSEIKLKRYIFFSFLFTLPLNILLNLVGSSLVNLWKNSGGLYLILICFIILVALNFFGPTLSDKILKKDSD